MSQLLFTVFHKKAWCCCLTLQNFLFPQIFYRIIFRDFITLSGSKANTNRLLLSFTQGDLSQNIIYPLTLANVGLINLILVLFVFFGNHSVFLRSNAMFAVKVRLCVPLHYKFFLYYHHSLAFEIYNAFIACNLPVPYHHLFGATQRTFSLLQLISDYSLCYSRPILHSQQVLGFVLYYWSSYCYCYSHQLSHLVFPVLKSGSLLFNATQIYLIRT